ncbi:hypothetical protein C8R46DRAFT_1094547 [Mycena filopes]|nr:hypothetical protein C8R46DRAFT_1094547 [Mycena filopes]
MDTVPTTCPRDSTCSFHFAQGVPAGECRDTGQVGASPSGPFIAVFGKAAECAENVFARLLHGLRKKWDFWVVMGSKTGCTLCYFVYLQSSIDRTAMVDRNLYFWHFPRPNYRIWVCIGFLQRVPLDFASQVDARTPNPYPELLATSAGPPTDFQATVLWAEVERAEVEIATLTPHITRLRDAIKRLTQNRYKLGHFAKVHRGVLSALRRFPNEILLEIFQYTVNPTAEEASSRAPWLVSQVCGHWRSVVVASPYLWRHILCPDSWDRGSKDKSMLLQIQRVQGAPVSMQFPSGHPPLDSALALCLGTSSQWEDLTIGYDLFVASALTNLDFPTLKTLTLIHRDYGVRQFPSQPHSLPILEHLVLHGRGELRGLLLPWSQLRKCDLAYLQSADVLGVLSQLRNADVSVLTGHGNNDPHPATRSLIRSLTITHPTQNFLRDVLDALSSPALEKLTLQDDDAVPQGPCGSLGERIARFLVRSACSLTDLYLDNELDDDDQLHILGSPHIRSVVHLDLPSTVLTSRTIALLACPLPNLRRLTLRSRSLTIRGDGLDEELLLTALATHNQPVISSGAGNLEGALKVVLV